MKVLLAYGSAMARVDDMKLFGGLSGGRTGKEILESIARGGDPVFTKGPSGLTTMGIKDHDLRVLTNSWTKHAHWPGTTFTFSTWQEYQDLLYGQCETWKPDVVICATAVSNYTPRYVVEEHFGGGEPLAHSKHVKGKIDSRKTESLLIKLEKTPNILNGVRERIGNNAVLVGFKLTSDGDEDHMLEFANKVIKDARCDLVVANDIKLGLENKWMVTPVGHSGPHDVPTMWKEIARLKACKDSGFYKSVTRADTPHDKDSENQTEGLGEAWLTARALWARFWDLMKPHGCLAVRLPGQGFVTTTRGKLSTANNPTYPGNGQPLTVVWGVDHHQREVFVGQSQHSQEKATLNAPLLDKMFSHFDGKAEERIKVIVHLHRQIKDLIPVNYLVPGTAMEANMGDSGVRAFNIQGHGSIVSFTTTDVDTIANWVEDPRNWR